jgi:hypothetical protein
MALSTNINTATTGIANHAVGRCVTDATAAAAATFNVGFKPRVIRFHNLTDSISQEWFEGMADLSAMQTVAAGTRTLSATTGPTLGTEAAGTLYSFTMPAATMVASKTYAWEAIG